MKKLIVILSLFLGTTHLFGALSLDTVSYTGVIPASTQLTSNTPSILEIEQVAMQIADFAATDSDSEVSIVPVEVYADGDLAILSDLLNFPNPFSWRTGTEVGYLMNQPAEITLQIYTITGMLVYSTLLETTGNQDGGDAGYNKVEISPSTVPTTLNPGVYLMVLLDGSSPLAKGKMVVLP